MLFLFPLKQVECITTNGGSYGTRNVRTTGNSENLSIMRICFNHGPSTVSKVEKQKDNSIAKGEKRCKLHFDPLSCNQYIICTLPQL